jgi:tritrans,polycis-undecaprenyl-diphosphate synthase [geranylgeranyl-diphosphate specific]
VKSPAYAIYKRLLWHQIKDGPIPHHVGIIPDGNRRWARSNGVTYRQAYEEGYLKIKEVLGWLLHLGVPNVTIFVLSSENCSKRSREELNIILDYLKRGLSDLLQDEIIFDNQVRIKAIGNVDFLPEELKDLLKESIRRTEKFKDRLLTLAICYGGRQEIVDAAKRIARDYKEGLIDLNSVNEETIRKYFYLNEVSDIDLVIRTSGEIRISNFLLWHIAYSELYFCDAYWPDFRQIDLWRAIRSYQRRKRNFGS